MSVSAPAAAAAAVSLSSSSCHCVLVTAVGSLVLLVPVIVFVGDVTMMDDKAGEVCRSTVNATTFERQL